MRLWAAMAALSLAGMLSACSVRPLGSEFEPIGIDRFKFSAKTGSLADREDDPAAERKRLRWLGEWLELNHLCPNGYRILSRQPVLIGDALGPYYNIHYTGECLP